MKVLIISYNPLTLSNNGGKRMMSLFSDFTENELMQFYVYPIYPDVKRCASYYRQTDLDLLYKLIGKHTPTHVIESVKDVQWFGENRIEKSKIYEKSRKNRAIKLIMRDILWKLIRWNTKELRDWIEKGKPDCIFSDTGDSCFLYNIALKLSKEYNIPIICSFGDDYYHLPTKGRTAIEKLQLALLKHKIKHFIGYCDKIISINDQLSVFYSETFHRDFGTDIVTIPTGSNFGFSTQDKNTRNNYAKEPPIISYLGNISLGRAQCILEIGRALDHINEEYKTDYSLNLYAKCDNVLQKEMRKIRSIRHNGFIPGEQVKDVIAKSDILIHVESFLQENIEEVRFSMSTKIADSLASGKCLLAYGPSDVASIQYLINKKCAYVVSEQDQLKEKLFSLLANPGWIREYASRAIKVALMYHDSSKNSRLLRSLLEESILKLFKGNIYLRDEYKNRISGLQ
jgi:hypothetical protein